MNRYEEIQLKYCSNSRSGKSEKPSRMGKRLMNNVAEAVPHFDPYTPVLDIGCGDGFGMGCFLDAGIKKAKGIEVANDRVKTAISFGLDVSCGVAENLEGILDRHYNVFCAHCLEHCQDQKKAISELQRVCKDTIWILVPVEPKGTGNIAHSSPVKDLEQITKLFNPKEWTVLRNELRFNLESEGLVAFKRI